MLTAVFAALAVAGIAGGCGTGRSVSPALAIDTSGDPGSGAELIGAHGCGACHRIPGIPGARSLVGPPLDGWSYRSYVAGALLNNEENLVRWLVDPQVIEPGTAMPSLGLTEAEARDITAYLFSRTG
ncbi:MAG: cytochrome c family protein [Acidimicrobiia bacterium]